MKHAVYIALMHGRDNQHQDLPDWGFDGPVIGPVLIHWTYGTLNLHHPLHEGMFQELPVVDGLVHYEGKYYGDFDIFTEPPPGRFIHSHAVFSRTLKP